jgi:serine/threonine-protein kinase
VAEVLTKPALPSPDGSGASRAHEEGRRTLEAVLRARGPLAPEAAIALGIEASAQIRGLRDRGHSPLRLDASLLVLRDEDGGVLLELGGIGAATLSDERTDVALVAQVIYHALAGRPPSSGSGDTLVNSSSAPPLRALAPWVELEVAELVHTAMAADASSEVTTLSWLEHALAPWTSLGFPLSIDALEMASRDLSRGSTVSSVHASWAPTAESVAAQPAPADRSVGDGKYRLVRRLGAGGMGVVFEAVRADGLRVAVKVLDTREGRLSLTAARRLVREARAAGSIVHDNVVRVIDAGSDDGRGRPWLAMELTNASNLAGATPLPYGMAARLFVQVLAGLEAAHRRGIIHRDVKPSNLLLHELEDGTLCAKIGDFGLAKETETTGTDATTLDLTRSEGLLGSPRYMSPEQAKSAKRLDHRSDLWSVAVSLYEALTGHRPFEDCTTVGEIIVAICTESLPDPRRFVPSLPGGLVDVVRRGTARDPGARFPSAQAFREALTPFAVPAAEVTRAGLREGRASMPDASGYARAVSTSASASAGSGTATESSGLALPAAGSPAPVPARRRWPLVAGALAAVVGTVWLGAGAGGPAAPPGATMTPAGHAPAELPSTAAPPATEAAPPPPVPSPPVVASASASASVGAPPSPVPQPRADARATPSKAPAVAPPASATAKPSAPASATSMPATPPSADRGLPPPIDNW